MHIVIIVCNKNLHYEQNIDDWCKEHCKNEYKYIRTWTYWPTSVATWPPDWKIKQQFEFYDKNDAALFKLVWG
jgi:hypothetical protein